MYQFKLSRRHALLAGMASSAALTRASRAVAAPRPGQHHTYAWINQVDGPRPEFVWENREDAIYHEILFADPLTVRAPEFWALMAQPWVFNRNMHWLRHQSGSLVCYEKGGQSFVTGEHGASRWFSDPDNHVSASGNETIFIQKSKLRRRDAVVVPSFQLHWGQHPTLRLSVRGATDDWQFVVSQKGRSGPPLLSSGWQRGDKQLTFDLAAQLQKRGWTNPYVELHFVMGVWAKAPGDGSRVAFSLSLESEAAIVASLPATRTATNAQKGLPIAAVFTNAKGEVLDGQQVRITAKVGDKHVVLKAEGEMHTANLLGLAVGDHNVTLQAHSLSGAELAPATQLIARVCRDGFFRYDRRVNAITHRGKIRKPMTGSFQGTFFVRDAGLPTERFVQSQADWDAWPRHDSPGEHQHYWESLTEEELHERFARLQACGWDLVHLHSHYGIWERFDAGGALAPHAAEQLARYIRVADRHGLAVMFTLSSYPYCLNPADWAAGTNPWQSYIDAGFKNEDWKDPKAQPFATLYHRYLQDITTMFANETAVFSLSSSGEGDWKAGIPRLLDTMSEVRRHDTSHLFVSEPVNMVEKLLTIQTKGFPTDLVGNRTYCLGWHMPFELEMGMVFRMNQMVPNMYLAEGCFGSSNAYTKLVIPPDQPEHTAFIGTPQYRLNVRDVLYLGLIRQQPILMTWDEAFTEDERIVLKKVAGRFDWSRPIRKASVAVRIADQHAHENGRPGLAPYEDVFSHLGIDYMFVDSAAKQTGIEWLIDHVERPLDAKAIAKGLTDKVKATAAVVPSADYAVASLVHDDGAAGMAYLYNTCGHLTRKTFISPTYHRDPRQATLQLRFGAVAEGRPFELWDLAERKVVMRGTTKRNDVVKVAESTHDFLLAWGL